MIQFPNHSFLHRSFYTLFETIISVSNEILNLTYLKNKIIFLFNNKNKILASYWGYLITISELINEIDNNDFEWNVFFLNTIQPYLNKFIQPYGGKLPIETELSIQEEEEEEEEVFFEEEFLE